MTRLGFHPEALAEARAAWLWYRERSPLAAAAFLVELDLAVESVAEAPDRWPQHIAGTRRYLFHRFPFALVYRLHGNTVQVIAVAHGRRRPGYWRPR
jgi:plasmid stabilization system protein ParE